MSELTMENVELVGKACRAKLPSIAQSLNRCFETQFALSPGEQTAFASLAEDPQLAGPGVIVAFSVGSSAMLCAVSASLPIPHWYTDPSAAQIDCLEALALEWSRNCLPNDFAGEDAVSLSVPSLGECIARAAPHPNALCLPLMASEEGAKPAARIWLIWPVERVPTPDAAPANPTRQGEAPSAEPAPVAALRTISPVERLRNLPVTIIVKLAEKRIEMGQLLGIGTGAIITFEKSCEDLLDLHVNNQLYCRGEAVKIGEKFGIKICEVGSTKQRISAVLAID